MSTRTVPSESLVERSSTKVRHDLTHRWLYSFVLTGVLAYLVLNWGQPQVSARNSWAGVASLAAGWVLALIAVISIIASVHRGFSNRALDVWQAWRDHETKYDSPREP